MRNQYDNKDCLEMGNTAEAMFEPAAFARGFSITPATKEENIDKHIDFWITKSNKTYSVDVKAAKRISRAGIS